MIFYVCLRFHFACETYCNSLTFYSSTEDMLQMDQMELARFAERIEFRAICTLLCVVVNFAFSIR